MKKILAVFLISSSIALGMIAFGVVNRSATTGPNPNADSFSQGPAVDTSTVIVQLKADPLSTYSATKPAAGRKIDFKNSAVRSYRAQLSAGRNDFRKWLQANAPGATITNEYDITLNGVAVELNGTPLATIAAAPMVEQAPYSVLYHPDLSQSYQIINAVGAWNAAGGRPIAARGLRLETSTRELIRRIRSSIRLASAILRASPSAIN